MAGIAAAVTRPGNIFIKCLAKISGRFWCRDLPSAIFTVQSAKLRPEQAEIPGRSSSFVYKYDFNGADDVSHRHFKNHETMYIIRNLDATSVDLK